MLGSTKFAHKFSKGTLYAEHMSENFQLDKSSTNCKAIYLQLYKMKFEICTSDCICIMIKIQKETMIGRRITMRNMIEHID